jgi:hypothetical protein
MTSFHALNGLMEWVAMQFALCNSPTTFQRIMNGIQRDFLHMFIIAYLNNVCVYNRNREEHLKMLFRQRKSKPLHAG